MKKVILLLFTVLLVYSCTNQEQPNADETKEKVITENQSDTLETPNSEERIDVTDIADNELDAAKDESPKSNKSESDEKVAGQKSKSVTKSATENNPAISQKQPSKALVSGRNNSNTIEITLPIDFDELSKLLRQKDRNVVITSSNLSKNKANSDDDDDGIMGFVDNNPIDTSAGNAKIKMGAFDEMIGESRSGEEVGVAKGEAVPEYIRKPKPFAEDFTGYRIEIMTVYNKPLSLNDELFKSFGGVTYRQKTANSTTYYIGNFQDKDAVEDYMQKVLKDRYPNAKGVRFKNGEEVKYK